MSLNFIPTLEATADRFRHAFRDYDREMGSGLLLAAGTVVGAVFVLLSFQPNPAGNPEPTIIPVEEPDPPFHTATDAFRAFPIVLTDDEPKEKPVTIKQAEEAFSAPTPGLHRARRYHGRR